MRLLQLPGVCGVGIEKEGTGEYVLVVHVSEREAAVPKTLEGHRVKIVRSGPFKPR
jgi:hypothetical protein